MRTKDNTKRIPFSDVAKGLNQAFENADPQRLAGLTQLQRVRAIKGVGLQREQTRLTGKLGATHPRVTGVSRKLEANRELERDVALGVSRARTPAVQPDPDAWTLHGHVRNPAREGLPNMTVALYDEKNQWIEELGHACTDANGYFRLTVKSGGTTKRTSDVEPAREAAAGVEAAPDAATVAARDTTAAAGRAAHIHVTDKQSTTRYIDANPLVPKLGEVVYREIILDGDGCECTPPDSKQSGSGGKGGKDKGAEPAGRYLGNRGTRELHDLKNTKPGCQIDEIKGSQREYFTNQKEATAAGYDFCAYCFGKKRSRR